MVCTALIMLPFFSSMLITNDVVLLTFVPIAILALEAAGWRGSMVRVIVLQVGSDAKRAAVDKIGEAFDMDHDGVFAEEQKPQGKAAGPSAQAPVGILFTVEQLRAMLTEAYILKDYFATMVLREVVSRNSRVVFKGGTCLSKCHHAIDRFSEDIGLGMAEDRNWQQLATNHGCFPYAVKVQTGMTKTPSSRAYA